MKRTSTLSTTEALENLLRLTSNKKQRLEQPVCPGAPARPARRSINHNPDMWPTRRKLFTINTENTENEVLPINLLNSLG